MAGLEDLLAHTLRILPAKVNRISQQLKEKTDIVCSYVLKSMTFSSTQGSRYHDNFVGLVSPRVFDNATLFIIAFAASGGELNPK